MQQLFNYYRRIKTELEEAREKMPLEIKIICILIVMLLLTMGISLLLLYRIEKLQIIEKNKQTNAALLQLELDQLDRLYLELPAILNSMAYSPLFQQFIKIEGEPSVLPKTGIHRALQIAFLEINNFYPELLFATRFIGKQGLEQVIVTGKHIENNYQDVSKEKYYREMIQRDAFQLGPPVYRDIEGVGVVFEYGMPVEYKGKKLGLLVMTMRTGELDLIFESFLLDGLFDEAYVMDEQGKYIFNPQQPQMLAQDALDRHRALFIKDIPGKMGSYIDEESQSLLSYITHDNFGIRIVLLTKPQKMFEELNTIFEKMVPILGTGGILFFVSLIFLLIKLKNSNEELLRHQSEIQQYNVQLEDHNKQILNDLILAGNVQKSIFPPLKVPPFLKMAVRYLPHSEVSGDIYYFHEKPGDHFDVFLGDATGHGVSAAFLTIMANMALINKQEETSVKNILDHLNALFEAHTPDNKFLSGIYLRINPEGQITYSNAGHPDTIVIPANNDELVFLPKNGILLGVLPNDMCSRQEKTYQLEPGDVVLLYTDGMIEQRNAQKEMYGSQRFLDLVEAHRKTSIDFLLSRLLKELAQFSKGSPKEDDLTLIAFQYQPTTLVGPAESLGDFHTF
ncbi:MAG: SpoIIE family protein phosphatase [SAR324 cluster bacterium]|nr:SpoIIE family protein phosphatase [SAR324 cluster bacterium]